MKISELFRTSAIGCSSSRTMNYRELKTMFSVPNNLPAIGESLIYASRIYYQFSAEYLYVMRHISEMLLAHANFTDMNSVMRCAIVYAEMDRIKLVTNNNTVINCPIVLEEITKLKLIYCKFEKYLEKCFTHTNFSPTKMTANGYPSNDVMMRLMRLCEKNGLTNTSLGQMCANYMKNNLQPTTT